MPSELGKRIRAARKEKGLSLRELARRISKSPSVLSELENEEDPPAVTEATLRAIEQVLQLESYDLVTLAGRTPKEVIPTSPLEVTLYREIKRLSVEEKEDLLHDLINRR